jgi:hypothetical protein
VPEARGCHAADRRVRAGVDEERQARVLERFLQCDPADPGFHLRIHVLRTHAQHTVHLPHIYRDAATHRMYITLKRSARPEWDNRQPMPRACLHDRAYFVRRPRKADQIWQARRMTAFAVAVVLAHRVRCRHSIAQNAAQLAQRGFNCRLPLGSLQSSHSFHFSLHPCSES